MISKLIQGILWIIGAFMIGFVLFPLCGCDECDGSDMKCEGNTIEICEDEVWEPYANCSDWDTMEVFKDAGPWECCEFGAGVYCVPEAACEEILYRP